MAAVGAVMARPVLWQQGIQSVNCPRSKYLHRYNKILVSRRQRLSLCCAIGVPNEKPFKELNRAKIVVQSVRKVLWNSLPEPIKEFPWKKAGEILLDKLLVIWKKAFKWVIVPLFIFNCLSDVILSITKNGELMIPLGLSIGFILAEFFKETSRAMLQEEKEMQFLWQLASIASFFVLLRLIYVPNQGQILVSHVCNGGLLQVLWLGKKFWLQDDESCEEAVNKNPSDTESN